MAFHDGSTTRHEADGKATRGERETDSSIRGNLPRRLMDSAEGHILRTGLVLAVVYVAGLGLLWLSSPQQAPVLSAMTALNVLVGRAAGMSFGYAGGLEHRVVIPANMAIETIQVMTIYPLFVFSWRHLVEIRALKSLMLRMRRVAEARHGSIERFGILGLFVFVFIPFWMTGPVVGSVVGFLIGLRPWINMVVVLTATFVAIGVWAVLLHGLTGWAAAYNRYAPFALVLALALLVVLGRSLHKGFRR